MKQRRDIWILAAVTYSIVAALTIGAAVYYFRHSTAGSRDVDQAGLIIVGSVWIPTYPGATILDHTSSVNDQVTQTTVRLTTQDSSEKMFSFYQAKLKGGPYLPHTRTQNGTILADRRDGKARILVTVSAAPEGATARITALEKRPAK
jgi:hypothetical protein